ncbi:meso-butanediol dehydrogenase / (S,S)-butanediol dehydrogenase / diacetyl reductase [Sphingobium sp. AP50]|uniref:SDR family NAD(P)-dependent oxidoreductase n=1 Tax=Sphingobium sp. AP50 TaxID=1884369 RepID=UPI0008C4D7BB|nr:SDR family NAD(P)-dependent oxidoreductase [Sphingobium sp. AP50]SEK05046.1 meso-butanediol dehydrogenase / (S,S)-butanediol dehydrogenase / diacetyl reductase [Sphingobium sp. AP50]
MKNLSGKVVLVTGGASGLGKATVERFAAEGARVVVADLNAEGAQAVAAQFGGQAVRMNVADPGSVEEAISCTVESFGRLDVLVNNAGIESARALIHEATLENWRKVIDVNLTGVFYCMKYALGQLLRQGDGGNIVNISSIAGMVAVSGLPPYVAAKAGVSNLTREAAIEYGPHGIRVNAVAPTAVYTPLLQRMAGDAKEPAAVMDGLKTLSPLHGLAEPEDIAAAVAFLASDDARFISGVTLPVDGGFTAQ